MPQLEKNSEIREDINEKRKKNDARYGIPSEQQNASQELYFYD
jgi:hypothetical protein